MTDYKEPYSAASSDFVENDVADFEEAKRLYEKSKARESKHNEEWAKHPVNLNDIVDRFAPGSKGEKSGVKYIYKGAHHHVITDMASGYLRVRDVATKEYLKFDGTFSRSDKGTHFKIKKREEM